MSAVPGVSLPRLLGQSLGSFRVESTTTDTLRNCFDEYETALADGASCELLVLGRRGAGKSSVLNALLGKALAEVGPLRDTTQVPKSYSWFHPFGLVQLWDCPGVRAASQSDRNTALGAFVCAEERHYAIWVAAASDVDSGVDEDLALLASWQKTRRRLGRRPLELLVVISKVDELAPADEFVPPFGSPEKLRNIQSAVEVFRAALLRHKLRFGPIVPVCAYQSDELELCWNLTAVSEAVAPWLNESLGASGTARETRWEAALLDVCAAHLQSLPREENSFREAVLLDRVLAQWVGLSPSEEFSARLAVTMQGAREATGLGAWFRSAKPEAVRTRVARALLTLRRDSNGARNYSSR